MSIRALLHNPRIPKEVRHAFAQAIVSSSAEQVLWREVCARHTLDAFGIAGVDEAEDIVAARGWFKNNYDDVLLAFEYAGVNHEPVVKALEKLGFG
ncbi:MAG: hypothetical protein RB191_19345 [Terriglobia bacterium]|nr:hypothetical protein [Terriglobia bacterium]